jgi:[ribosomal protein S5]-alanine N-acetyltransferase
MKLLEFIPATRKVLRQLATEPEEFAAEHGVVLHDVAQSVGEAGLKFVRSFPYETPPEWFGYLAVEGESQRLCGVCSFKGPAVEQAVEISYYTFPGFEGQGIGTAMARFLVECARSLPDVTRVIAHTFEERNASARILQKIGMRFTGPAEEDGEPVWGWELDLTADIK